MKKKMDKEYNFDYQIVDTEKEVVAEGVITYKGANKSEAKKSAFEFLDDNKDSPHYKVEVFEINLM